jgi:hypothetical protein
MIAMDNKSFIVATIILSLLFSLMTGVLLANFAVAGPPIGLKPIYAKVSIESPQNGSEDNVQLSFTIKTNRFLQSYSNYSDSHCFIILDSKSTEFKELHIVGQTTISNDDGYNPYTELTLIGNTSLSNFSNLEIGTHAVEVKYGFYYAWPNNSYQIDYIVLSSAFAQFTLNSEISSESASASPTPTPSPALSPIPSPSSLTQQPTVEPTQPASPISSKDVVYASPDLALVLGSIVVILAVATVTLVYLKKHNKDKQLKE